ncbi:AAA family ATPase [Kitasatospora sp. LaBMicrA B282]|uniref:AAA family ATPase n=1 Tax=Kitasatospora sp. LaBMicrA B282 TaxID=3420949 RepID=UPI003D0B99F0
MVLVERGRELTILDEMLVACSGGRGGVALISGAAGSGKTELLNAFAERAAAAGAGVLSAVAAQSECDIPFGVADQFLHNASLALDRSPDVHEALRDGVRLADVPANDPERIHPEHARVLARLIAAMLHAVGNRPLVLAVDDLQHADRLSLHFLRYLARRIRNQRVLLVMNVLAEATPTLPLLQMEILGQANSRNIRLEPLSRRGVAQLMADAMPGAEVPRLLPAYELLSGGNPLLVNALIEDQETGTDIAAEIDRPTVAHYYRQAVGRCVRRCDPVTAEVAHGLAVLDLSRATQLVGRLLSLEHDVLQRCEHLLHRVGLLGPEGFRHPGTRAAVLDSLDPARRAELHRRAARLLFVEGAQAAEVARHLLAADDASDPWAVPLLLEAAEQALQEDQYDLAAECTRLAHRDTAGTDRQASVTLMLAQIDGQANPIAAVRHCTALTDALHDGELQPNQFIQLVKYLLQNGALEQAEEALRHAGSKIRRGAGADSGAWEPFRLWLGCTFPPLAAKFAEVLDSAGGPRLSVGRATDPRLQAAALLDGVLRGTPSQSDIDAALEHLQALRLSDTSVEPLAMALTAMIYTDRHRAAVPWGEALLAEARARRVPSWIGVLSSITAKAAIRCGDLAAAERHALAALEWNADNEYAVATLLRALTLRGDLAAARELLNRPPRGPLLENPAVLYYQHARGHYYLARQRPRAALLEFGSCAQSMRSWGMDLPALVPWRTDVAQALIGIGRTGEARELAAEQLAMLTAGQARSRALSLRVLALASDPVERPPLLAAALASLDGEPDPVERARILGVLGHTHDELDDPETADRLLGQAADLARESRADSLLRELAPVGDPQSPALTPQGESVGIEDLSKAEQRVARLVSRGHTNSEVADKLFITVSTVEQHLTRIYRKLGIKHRSSLQSLYQGGVLAASC